MIDAGHGGEDTGAGYDMLFEKNLALGISKKLKAMSDSKTVEILLTREADNTTTFAERVKIAEQEQVDLFLRLHFNSSIKSSQRGLEAYYYKEGAFQQQSYNFSKILVAEQLASIVQEANIKTADFYILQHVDCPAILLELSFITNPSYRKKLSDRTI